MGIYVLYETAVVGVLGGVYGLGVVFVGLIWYSHISRAGWLDGTSSSSHGLA